MIGSIGLLLGLAVLIYLALRGVNVIFASLLSSLIVIIFNQLPLAEGFSQYYSFGSVGAFTFAGKFFLLFVSGAILGRLMGESHAATSLAVALANKFGPHRTLWIVTLSSALLTYGGVVVFVVIFAIYPLGLRLSKEANIPKRLLLGAIALGSGTFTLTALPGTPSVQNVIASAALGTDLFAGAFLGLLAAAIMLGGGMWYLESQRAKAIQNEEGFIADPSEERMMADKGVTYPHWFLSIIPLIIVLSAILLPRLLLNTSFIGEGELQQLIQFANQQPILWPSIAMLIGSISCVALFPIVRKTPMLSLSKGAEDAILPLLSTAAVIGFGGVVTHTAGFQSFIGAATQWDLPPLLSMFFNVSMVSGLVGSSSGGLQIFMGSMAQEYLAMGIAPEVLHRLAAIASGGFDSLPHCGAVVAMLTITKMTHKQAYKDVAVITVVIPVLATFAALGAAAIY